MAHGEFIAMGSYVTTYLITPECPCPIPSPGASGGVFGIFLERTIVRQFPTGRSIVGRHWGISLIMTRCAPAGFRRLASYTVWQRRSVAHRSPSIA
jgi:branched-subunit amino acid ABC-type transport system permease component